MTAVRVKICGLTRRPDAELAAASGAHYGGVILAPGGRRSIDLAAAAEVLDGLPLRRVGVFVDATVEEMRRAAHIVSLDVLQLHGSELPETAQQLRSEGRWEVWKALRPRPGMDLVTELRRYAGRVDGILLDGWSPSAPGGTGTPFPWEAVAPHRDAIPPRVSLVVAGGLSPSNVRAAIELLRPDVVDVSSGVEDSPGVKNADAVTAFISAALDAVADPFPRS
ncbi:MAG TPA: phosphoribosylanthranilate isomerase [Longimicrobiaceae bacterium]